VPPSLKVTVPVAEAGVTAAVRVIACPKTAVGAEAARETVDACSCDAATTPDTTLDVDALSDASPAYDAVMLWVPAVSVVMVNVADPFVRDAVPRDVEPSKRVTVPAGEEPADGVTATVKVTDCPALICAADAESAVVVVAAVVEDGSTTNIAAEYAGNV
jgi:hypothetical protein